MSQPDWLNDAIEAEANEPAPKDALGRVTELAELLSSQQQDVETLKRELQDAKERYNATRMEHLPQLMQEVGLKSLTLEDGSVVSVKEEVDAAITAAKAPMALKWLVDHGFGGLIKTKVITEFDRDDYDNAVALAQSLQEEHPGVQLSRAVHPSTLKSFVKEQLQNGAEFPMELFGVHPYNVATLKKGK